MDNTNILHTYQITILPENAYAQESNPCQNSTNRVRRHDAKCVDEGQDSRRNDREKKCTDRTVSITSTRAEKKLEQRPTYSPHCFLRCGSA